MSDVKGLDGSILPSLLTVTHISLLGWFHSLCEVPCVKFGNYPPALTFLTSWSLHNNPGFIFTASHNGLWGPPHSDFPATSLASEVILH